MAKEDLLFPQNLLKLNFFINPLAKTIIIQKFQYFSPCEILKIFLYDFLKIKNKWPINLVNKKPILKTILI
jgi:hypothetical protein